MKVKKFSKRLLSLFLALLMALSCMTGAFQAFAAVKDPDYHDNNIAWNFMAWAELTDEQTAGAVLDWLDEVLAGVNLTVSVHMKPLQALQALQIDLEGKIDSVDNVLILVDDVWALVKKYQGLLGGDVKNIDLSPISNLSNRSTNSAKEIIMAIAQNIYIMSNDFAGSNILKQFLLGQLDLGLASALDLYGLLGGKLGLEAGYQSNMVYNILKPVMVGAFCDQTTEEGLAKYNYLMGLTFDDMAMSLLSTDLLQKIEGIDASVNTYKWAQKNEDGSWNKDTVTTTDMSSDSSYYPYAGHALKSDYAIGQQNNLAERAFVAFQQVWESVLSSLFGRIQVQYTHLNIDNIYNDYMKVNGKQSVETWLSDPISYDWNGDIVKDTNGNNISNLERVVDELNNICPSLVNVTSASSVADVINALKICYNRHDRTTANKKADGEKYTFQDIDAEALFQKLLYSPLAAELGCENGILNLCITETYLLKANVGEKLLFRDVFTFDFSAYTGVIQGFNDFLVALLYELFPTLQDGTLAKTGNTLDTATIVSTLISNACTLIQYVGDETDANILAQFYADNGADAKITEANVESAMVPFMIAVIKASADVKQVHDSKWLACTDAEDVAYVCLEEYLSYIVPEYDYTALLTEATKDSEGNITAYNASIEGVILPMARDALCYILESIVPLTNKDGSVWNIYKLYDSTNGVVTASASDDIFDLLNSVVCYYAVDCGIGNLLGFTDFKCGTGSGALTTCAIKQTNSLWQNLSLIVNKLLPDLGEMLGYGQGNLDTQDLIYEKLILGMLDIGPNQGVSTALTTIIDALKTHYFQSDSIVDIVYDVLQKMLNFVIGARDSNDKCGDLILARTADKSSPFDAFLQIANIAGASGVSADIGVIGRFICRVYEGFGGSCYRTCQDTCWEGAMYIVTAVNNFIPSFVPQISAFKLSGTDIYMKEATKNSYTAGSTISNYVCVHNNSLGINRAYINAAGDVIPASRVYVRVDTITHVNTGSVVATNPSQAALVAPDAIGEVPVSYSVSSSQLDQNGEYLAEFLVSYSYVDQNGTLIKDKDGNNYTGLTASAYQFVTTDYDWYDAVYNEDGTFKNELARDTEDNYTKASNYIKRALSGVKYKHMYIQYPKNVVIKKSMITQLDKINVRIVNEASKDWAIDGVFAYTDNQAYGIPTVDMDTGDIINMNYYDYFKSVLDENGKPTQNEDGTPAGTWVRGAYLMSDIDSLKANDPTITATRYHVALTLAEASAGGILREALANYQNADGTYNGKQVQLQGSDVLLDGDMSTTFNASYANSDPTWSTGIDGIYFSMQKQIVNNSTKYVQFLKWDGKTDIEAQSTNTNVCFFRNDDGKKTVPWTITVADDTESVKLNEDYSKALEFMSTYKPEDFADYNSSTETSETYNYVLNSAKAAVKALGTPINNTTALDTTNRIASIKSTQVTTKETTARLGETVYQKATSLPDDMVKDFYLVDGYYYVDEAGTVPVYTNVKLNEAGYDMLSAAEKATMELDSETGDYRFINAPAYEYVWKDMGSGTGDFFENPYYAATETQKTTKDAQGNVLPLYSIDQYDYKNAEGGACSSDTTISGTTELAWRYKIPQTYLGVTPGAENRGIYLKANDKLNYALEIAKTKVSSSAAEILYNMVTEKRAGMNNVNYDVITYEKMAKAARDAEALITVDDIYTFYSVESCERDKYGKVIYDEKGAPIFLEGATPVYTNLKWADFEKALEADNENKTDEAKLNASDFVWTSNSREISTTASSFEIYEAIRVFNTYWDYLSFRGVDFTKLDEEITHYNTIKAAVDASETQLYTTESWNNYVAAYNKAVDYKAGTLTNEDGTEVSQNYTTTFSIRKDLMLAENALVPYVEEASHTHTLGTPVYDGEEAKTHTATCTAADCDLSEGYTVTEACTFDQGVVQDDGSTLYTCTVCGGTYSVAPAGYTVSGNIYVMTTAAGATASKPVPYACTLTVANAEGTPVTEVTSTAVNSGTKFTSNTFSIPNLPNGTYTVTVTGAYAVSRTVTLVVNGADITTANIPICACNYNTAKVAINAADLRAFNVAYSSGSFAAYPEYDLNADGKINATDARLVNVFYSVGTVTYPALTIQ